MEVISQVGLDVTRVVDSANPALFCTRWGGPITFHLQVGDGEESLLKPIQKTVNVSGGRYVKRYHEMTPYTVLLVTDQGFRKDTFNRPAVCVTYIGDCVFSNSLRNVNDYLHPWDDGARWKKVDLFAVMYSQMKMFQCSPRYILKKPYVAVSRKSKIVQAPVQTPSIQNLSESSESLQVSSDDDDLFIKEEQLTDISEASTNLKSLKNPCVNFDETISIKIEEDTEFEVAKESLENPRPNSTDLSDYQCFPDEQRSISGVNQRIEVPLSQGFENRILKDVNTHSKPLRKITKSLQRNSDNLSDSTNRDDDCMTADDSIFLDRVVLPTVAATTTNQNGQLQTSQNQKKFKRKNDAESKPSQKFVTKLKKLSDKPRQSDNSEGHRLLLRYPYVLLERIPESVILDKMPTTLVSGQKNTQKKSAYFNASENTSENVKDKHEVSTSDSSASPVRNNNAAILEETQFGIGGVMPNQKDSGNPAESGRSKDQMPLRTDVPLERTSERECQHKMSSIVAMPKKNPQKVSAYFSTPSTSENSKSKPAVSKKGNSASIKGNSKVATPEKTFIQMFQGRKPPKDRSGISISSTSNRNTCKKRVDEPSANLVPTIALIHSSSSRSTSEPSIKGNTKAVSGKSLGNKCSRLQISVKNSSEVSKNRVGRNPVNGEEASVEESSPSIGRSIQIPSNLPNDSPLPSPENAAHGRASQVSSTSTSSPGPITPKLEFKDEEELVKKRGRGFQDRYRRCEKVALLKWLVEHKKFRNLRGVLVWKEMERKKIVPGRSYQSLKNQFLRHLLGNLDAFPFLSEEDKRKFREPNVELSDDDGGFFYHGSSHHFAREI